MPQRLQVVLKPRKLPVQARSAASVDAIMQATIQVLREVGKERLTTTRVAHRAGVSVGTLYSVSSDVDGAKIMQEGSARSQLAIARMLASAPQPPASDPALTASLIVGTLGGVSRRMLESGSPRKLFEAMRQELITCLCAYVEAGSASGTAADSAAALRA